MLDSITANLIKSQLFLGGKPQTYTFIWDLSRIIFSLNGEIFPVEYP